VVRSGSPLRAASPAYQESFLRPGLGFRHDWWLRASRDSRAFRRVVSRRNMDGSRPANVFLLAGVRRAADGSLFLVSGLMGLRGRFTMLLNLNRYGGLLSNVGKR
jgi:hypothetical protein